MRSIGALLPVVRRRRRALAQQRGYIVQTGSVTVLLHQAGSERGRNRGQWSWRGLVTDSQSHLTQSGRVSQSSCAAYSAWFDWIVKVALESIMHSYTGYFVLHITFFSNLNHYVHRQRRKCYVGGPHTSWKEVVRIKLRNLTRGTRGFASRVLCVVRCRQQRHFG